MMNDESQSHTRHVLAGEIILTIEKNTEKKWKRRVTNIKKTFTNPTNICDLRCVECATYRDVRMRETQNEVWKSREVEYHTNNTQR